MRERKEDIPALLQHGLQEYTGRHGKEVTGFAPAVLEYLLRYDFPGNIRELRNIVERAVLLCDVGGSVLPEHLPAEIIQNLTPKEFQSEFDSGRTGLREVVNKFEASIIERKLNELNWNQTKTAKDLHISRRTLIDKIHKYNIRRTDRQSASFSRIH